MGKDWTFNGIYSMTSGVSVDFEVKPNIFGKEMFSL